jgi:alkylation response protein AidB-like acyl-CoA dehydrogenase
MSATTLPAIKKAKGGSFLIEDSSYEDVFTPEDLSDEQIQIAKTAAEFSSNEVLPATQDMEAKKFDVTRRLLRKAGELGLLAVDIPEAYGGLEMDKVTSALITESLSQNASFSVTFGAHSGIGTLPLVWYGTEEQKKKYLPKLATGEWVGAYALSEASSGSDAMNIRTRAVLDVDGKHYILNGEKMWISNAGFADIYTVFAKIDGEKFSAFLVERNTPGLSIGEEEHKLGIRGSSTCPLVLNDCRVPVGNLLGEAGKGHHIAFNILNIGRFKLGAACVGGARVSLQNGIRYAKERKAFGKPIAEFGLVQEKIAECATGIYAGESLAYRTIGMIDAALADLDQHAAGSVREIQKQIEEYAVECSILKVWGSEMLDRVVDHVVQIYGGYGYVEEYPAASAYRDARINRIFEGTNEINRLIITGWLMKRAMTGQFALLPAIKKVMDEITEPQLADDGAEGPLSTERRILTNVKKLSLFAAGAASQKHMQDLQNQQEIMGALADCIIEVYALESCLLRAEKLLAKGSHSAAMKAIAMTQLYAAKSFQIVETSAKKVISAVAEGDLLRTQMAILRRLSKHEPVNSIALSRDIASSVVQTGRCSL